MRGKIAWPVAGALALLPLLAAAVEAQTPRERETVQVGLIDRTFFPQPVMIAIQNGYFADEGLNANIRFIRSGEGQAEGLTKGELQFALSSVEGIMRTSSAAVPCACWPPIPAGSATSSSRRRNSPGSKT